MSAKLYSLLCFAILALLAPIGLAQSLPVIPDSTRILSSQEVKNYWVNKLPTPRQPSRLARDYHSAIVVYHQQVGERHRLVQAIRAGHYDRHAKIIALRHNIKAYIAKGEEGNAAGLRGQLAALEGEARKDEEAIANADRLERLIAATERLAAAIENNGGEIPNNAEHLVQEIVPFERAQHDRRDIVTHLYEEIALCRQPIIVHQRTNHNHVHQRTHTNTNSRHQHHGNRTTTGSNHQRVVQQRSTITPRQPQTRQPQTRQPQVRPVQPRTVTSRQPTTRTIPTRQPVKRQPQTRTIPTRQPQTRTIPTRQPQVRPAKTPQPQVRPATKITPRQPQVRPVPAPRQPQVRPAR